MSVPVALKQLLSLLADNDEVLSPEKTLAISASRLGAPDQTLIAGTLSQLASLPESRFGGPLHSFVIVGKRLHQIERDFARRFAVDEHLWIETCNVRYGVRD